MSLDTLFDELARANRVDAPSVAELHRRARRHRRRQAATVASTIVAALVLVIGAAVLAAPRDHGTGLDTTNEPTTATSTPNTSTSLPTTTTTGRATTSTTPPAIVDLPITDQLKATLAATFAAANHFAIDEVTYRTTSQVPTGGPLLTAHVRSTGTSWAVAWFEPTSHAGQQTLVNLQDGGDIGVFRKYDGGTWTWYASGGLPFPCAGVAPSAVLAYWHLALSSSCGTPTTLPPIAFSSLPNPPCPAGYTSYAPANPASAMCVPPAYIPAGGEVCPSGSTMTMGPALCVSDTDGDIVEPVKPSS
jgi:hypothetical protein